MPGLPLHANELSKLEAELTLHGPQAKVQVSSYKHLKQKHPQAHTKLYLEHLYIQTEDSRNDCKIFNVDLNK